MMAGNPSWWSMHSSRNNLRSSTSAASDHHHQHQEVAPSLFISQTHPSTNPLLPVQYLHSSSSPPSSTSSSLLPFSSLTHHHHEHEHEHHGGQDFPHSWSQLLLGGFASEQEEKFGPSLFQPTRLMNNTSVDDVKQETTSPNNTNTNNNNDNNLYGYQHHEEQEAGVSNRPLAWSHQAIPVSSPRSCVTSLSSNNNNNNNTNSILDFSASKRTLQVDSYQHADNSNSECNSTTSGEVPNKKPRNQPSSTPPLKVRKEKLGDRITALHQLVSPFGKTDTASVLLEAIGYIRFLQGQIEALSSPYLGNNTASAKNQHSVHGERNCLFPDHPGQLLNDSCLKRRGAANNQEDKNDGAKDLKSRGLCLVPMSCMQLVGSDNGADYWAPSLGSGGF